MEYSGYDADEEHVGLFEREEEEEQVERRRNSLEQITTKRRQGSRKRHSDHLSLTHPISPLSRETFSPAKRVKKLRVSSSDSDESDGDVYTGRTSCRLHGQFPRRWRCRAIPSRLNRTQASSDGRQTQWPGLGSLVMLRGGMIKGTASNLNDQLPEDHRQSTPPASLRLYSHMFHESNPQNETFPTLPLVRTQSEASTSSGASQMNSMSSLHCHVSSQPCSIADAVAFSATPRLLLEAKAPHHVVHHNGAYESFLLQQPRWMLPDIQVSMQYHDLNTAIQQLFANQTATLQPVQVAPESSCNQPSTLEDATHFLLELVSNSQTPAMTPLATMSNSSPMDATAKETPSASRIFSTAMPAQAIG